ncbi:hypothetical protein [Synechococcus sp. BIOS-E4-1]|uniref:hypothetical protein n=1 Tax=Synechococcus sp. BIOS-E4-1 TaxID=1400864 RepID=UPI0021024CF2|nr:hypothetical protein [Synechococcus sp. BIOS-E4-1]
MSVDPSPASGPLDRQQIERIDATLLPAVDRHLLRLQAHCLATFQQIAMPLQQGPLPTRDHWQDWCDHQPQLANDAEFREQLMMQFTVIASQLEELARQLKLSPLELKLNDLIQYAEANSRDRLSNTE